MSMIGTRMTAKDFATLTVSLVALALSGTTACFNFIHGVTRVQASFLDSSLPDSVFRATIAVSNTGNKQIALTHAEVFLVRGHLPGADRIRLTQFAVAPRPTDARTISSLPLVLDAGKIALFEVAALTRREALLEYRASQAKDSLFTHSTTIGVGIEGISATGERVHGFVDLFDLRHRDTVLVDRFQSGEVIRFDVVPSAPPLHRRR